MTAARGGMAKNFAALLLAALLLVSAVCLPAGAEGVYTPSFETGAEGIYVVNEDYGVVMYAKNENKTMYPASLTKILTALCVLEKVSDLENTTGTMTEALNALLYNLGSANIGLVAGEVISVKDMLYAMMLRSAGDAALLAAQVAAGSQAAFAELMNQKAAELGCENSNFTNPHGLHDPEHYTTPADMYKITRAAMQNATFKEIVKTTSHIIPATNKKEARTIYTTNNMMLSGQSVYYKPVFGVKTGFTTPAGPCLAAMAVSNNITYTVIVMRSELVDANGETDRNGAFKVARDIYNWLYNDFEQKNAMSAGDPIGRTVGVKYGKGVDEVPVVVLNDYTTILPKNVNSSALELRYVIPAEIEAPVEEGQVVGTGEILIGDTVVGTVDLVAASAVEKSEISYVFAQIGSFLSSPVMLIIGIVLLVLLVGYGVLNVLYNNKKKRRYQGSKSPAKRNGRNKNIFR